MDRHTGRSKGRGTCRCFGLYSKKGRVQDTKRTVPNDKADALGRLWLTNLGEVETKTLSDRLA